MPAKPTSTPTPSPPSPCTPVTKESGKHRAVHFRWACNKRFRAAITTFADNSRHVSPWAAKIYNDARASGKDHPHAVRILARAWIRVIWRCWLDGNPYDPAKHTAAATLIDAETGVRLTQGVSCGVLSRQGPPVIHWGDHAQRGVPQFMVVRSARGAVPGFHPARSPERLPSEVNVLVAGHPALDKPLGVGGL